MKTKVINVILSFICLFIFHVDFSIIISGSIINVLQAQTPTYPYKKYENRKEGLVAKKTLVAGEKLVLISASMENQEIVPKNVASYNLGFYLKDSAKIKIEVREFDRYYKMEPLQDEYKPGIQTFSWPSEIPIYYNIGLTDLFPLAKISGAGILEIIPIVLYYEHPRSPDLIYRFGFIPNNAIRVLEFNIYKSGRNEPLFTGTLKDLLTEKVFHILWSGKDNQNNPVPSGLHVLNIKATFKSAPGSEVKKEVTLNYHFYHFADLFKQKEFSKK
jgi:hypothetical protein